MRPSRENLQDYFLNPCGILALVAATIPVLALLSLASRQVRNSFSGSMGILLVLQFGALIALITVIVLIYTRRFSLREYQLLRQARSAWSPSLAVLATVILAILLICASLVIAPHFSPRIIETPSPFYSDIHLFYFADIVAIALAIFLMLLAALGFIGRLNQRVPPPIYLRVDELASLVLSSAEERLGYGHEQLKPIAMKRTNSGGIRITAKGVERVKKKSNGELVTVKLDRVWNIEADQWGRVHFIEEWKKEDST
ncbi:MAG: hypothetical protein H8D43_01230 [Chloroflexi bacterium]|nr:hypothetical protein [Chloroflexota bacterium]